MQFPFSHHWPPKKPATQNPGLPSRENAATGSELATKVSPSLLSLTKFANCAYGIAVFLLNGASFVWIRAATPIETRSRMPYAADASVGAESSEFASPSEATAQITGTAKTKDLGIASP